MATFTNQATLTYNGTTTASNIVTGEILEVLSAQKNAVVDVYTAGDDITYVVSILNTGQAPLTGLTLTDDLGAYTFGAQTLTPLTYANGSLRYYVNGVLQPAPTVTAQAPLTVTGLNVPAGGNAMLVYEANTNQYAPRAAGKDQQYGVHQRRGRHKPCNRDRSGNRGRARGTDDQQGDFPAGRYRKRCIDLHLYDSEQRQYRGDSGRQCDGQRPLQSDSIQFGSQPERHAADRGDRLHLRPGYGRVHPHAGQNHRTGRDLYAGRCDRCVDNRTGHQHLDGNRNAVKNITARIA